MKSEEVVFLNQLVQSLDEAVQKLEVAYANNDEVSVNKIKHFIQDVQVKINEVLRK